MIEILALLMASSVDNLQGGLNVEPTFRNDFGDYVTIQSLNTPTEALKTYQSPLFGFKFDFPSEWPQIGEESNGVGFLFEGSGLALNAITVVVNDLSENTTLQKYLRDYLSQSSGVDYSTLLVNQSQITSQKIPAIRAEYDSGAGGDSSAGGISFGKSILYFAIKNNTAYIILYNFDDSIFENYVTGFQKMINSFEIS